MKTRLAWLVSLSLLVSAVSTHAMLVQEVAITPAKVVPISVTGFYTGNALAGINQLLVDGIAANGFCIDPFHFAVPSSPGYQFAPLATAPKAPGTMGVIKADQIARLWTMAYSPSMTAAQAAAFQIAIWEIVGGANFSVFGTDYGASALLLGLVSFSGPAANLVALTGPGQDYVIQDFRPKITVVPDYGRTVALLTLSIGTIALFNWRTRPA